MKKKSSPDSDELRPEYGSDLFGSMKANRFAGAELAFKGRRVVYLDEDVAEVFDTPEAVNSLLRSTIRAMRAAAPRVAEKSVRAKRRLS
jgi:hypothetical protein